MKLFLLLAAITLVSFAAGAVLVTAYGNVGMFLTIPTIVIIYWLFNINHFIKLRKGVIIND